MVDCEQSNFKNQSDNICIWGQISLPKVLPTGPAEGDTPTHRFNTPAHPPSKNGEYVCRSLDVVRDWHIVDSLNVSVQKSKWVSVCEREKDRDRERGE